MPSLQLVWSWRARALALASTAATAAISAWAAHDPKTAAWVPVAGAAVTLAFARVAAESLVFRVRVDAVGFTRRSLRGADALAWSELRGVRLIASRHEGAAIVHSQTTDPLEAFHARLLTDRAVARPWDFNGWMTGFDALLALAFERELPCAIEPPPPGHPLAAATLRALDTVNAIGFQLLAGFALLFCLFVGSVSIVVGLRLHLTRHFFLDLLLVALALLGLATLIRELARTVGARRLAHGGAPVHRTDWLMDTASLIGGVLLLVAFIPRALAGAEPDHDWATWLLVVFGAFMVYASLRH